MASTTTPGLTEANIGIVCALSKELSAVRAIFDCVADPTRVNAGSGRKYALAEVGAVGGGRHLVAIALLPEMGNNAAAIRAMRMLDDCPRITHLLMVGIAGAVPHRENPERHVRLGDVVVSDRGGVIQYDLVKEASDGSVEHRNAPRPPSSELLEAVQWLRSGEDFGNRPWETFIEGAGERLGPAWKRPAPGEDVLDDVGDGTVSTVHPEDPERRPGQPRVFLGPIAAANVLLKNAERREDLRRRFGAMAVEMEGSGIADAAWDGRVGYLVIRGTCDYCNRNKRDSWQKYAAVAAASYARALIESISAPDEARPIRQLLDVPENPDALSPGLLPPRSDLRYLYERAFEHGQLAGRLPQAETPETVDGAAATMLEGVRLALPPIASERAFSSPATDEALQRVLQRIRQHLETYDHDLAVVAARDLERLLAEPSAVLSPAVSREAYELLADVEIIDFKRMRRENAPGANTARAREFLDRARGASAAGGSSDPGLLATDAYLVSLDQGAEAGLARLEGRDDAQAARRKLSMLLDAGRFQEAAEVVGDRPLDKVWCDKAVSALVRVGETDRAKSAIRWAGDLPDQVCRRRCILCYAESRLVAAFHRRGKDEPVIPGSLDVDERSALADVIEELVPVLRVIRGNGRIDNALEEHAVRLALNSHHFLGNRPAVDERARLLAMRRPVPLALAHFVLAARLTADQGLPRRLREEHPGSYEASRLALLLEARLPGRVAGAFEEAIKIDIASLRREDRPRHFNTFYMLAQEVGEVAMKRVERLAPELLAPDLDSLKLFLADRYLGSNRTAAAREILEELQAEDDPRWLQLYAHLMHRSGEPDEAMRRLLEASRRVAEPELFREIGRVAYGLKRFDVLAEVLKNVIALDPADVRSRINYAGALIRIGDPKGAAVQFHVLRQVDPAEPWHAINEAASLAYAGELEAGLDVYEECCRADASRLEAVLGRAETLRLLDRPIPAFRSLDGVRNVWWDEARFVQLYMSVAYSAGMDRQGSLALARLVDLQRDGRTPGEVVTTVRIDDLKERFAGRREHDEVVSHHLFRGEVPWVMVEEGRGRVPYLGWSIRTQELPWCPNTPRERAELSVYASNGYCLVDGDAGEKELVRIECPAKGTPIAIDLTALYTLHALGLIDAAGGYFGKLLVPAVYLDRVLEERSRLLLHQLSQRTSLERIRSAIDEGEIEVVLDDEERRSGRATLVDEYVEPVPEGTKVYRLLDVFEPIYAHGRFREADFARAKQSCSGRPSDTAETPALVLFSPLTFDLLTLQTLARIGCLDPVIASFRVRITRDAEREVARGLCEFRFRDEVRTGHADLWAVVRADPRYVFTAGGVAKEFGGGDIEERTAAAISLGASWVAVQQGVPLLVDDRVVQVVTQNERPGPRPSAFGTDRLIESLEEAGAISTDQLLDATVRLMKWRYRFVLPSAEVLKGLLDRYKENPPGLELREVAEYVHDCMRDPGLFSGFEPTTPPASMAARLHQKWVATVALFVMKVWDDDWPEAGAREVTTWAIRELLPTLPATMPGPVQGALARLEHRVVLSMALIASSVMDSPERANAGLLCIADILGMKETDFHATIADVIAERE